MALNPGVFLGLGPCTLNGVSYPVCSTNANLNQRRVLYQQNPTRGGVHRRARPQHRRRLPELRGPEAVGAAPLGQRREPQRQLHAVALHGHADAPTLQPVERRLSRIRTTRRSTPATAIRTARTWRRDAGLRDAARSATAALRALASHWRVSGILNARSGSRLNITSGSDNAFNGIAATSAPNKVSDDVYGAKTLTSYFNARRVRAAGAGHVRQPAAQRGGGPGLLERRPGAVDGSSPLPARSGWSCAWSRSTCSTTSTGATR